MSDRIQSTTEGSAVVATLQDTTLTDDEIIKEVIAELLELITRCKHSHLVIDFSKVEFLSTVFLGQLISLKMSAAKSETKLILCGFSVFIMEAIHIVAFDRVFQIVGTREEALETCHS